MLGNVSQNFTEDVPPFADLIKSIAVNVSVFNVDDAILIVSWFLLDVLLLKFFKNKKTLFNYSYRVTLFGLLLHLCQLILIVKHLEGLVEEAVSLQVEFLLYLHIQGLDFHLQIANNWVLVELVIESVLNRLFTCVFVNCLLKNFAVAIPPTPKFFGRLKDVRTKLV